MHLLVDISAHGLGHLSQTAPVVEALNARVAGLRLTVRSALPRVRLQRRMAVGFVHVAEARDVGFVMHNAVDIDLAASAKAYRDLHQGWRDKIAVESEWLKTNRVDAVITNVAYLPLAAAAQFDKFDEIHLPEVNSPSRITGRIPRSAKAPGPLPHRRSRPIPP